MALRREESSEQAISPLLLRRKEQRTLSRCSKEVRSPTASDGTTGFTPGSTDESRGDDLPGVAMERGSDGCVAL
jgi:hypothetical protein